MIEYPSPDGSGTMRGLLARPADAKEKLPGVVVIHENRGLNPHIRDVARRTALAGYVALAPDALTPLGGYPGNDDDGREMQAKLDFDKMTADFVAAVAHLRTHELCTGRVGVVGFCFGGGMASTLAVRIPDLAAAVSFYGRQPAVEDVPKIQAPLLLHFAGLDQRINEGWPAFEAALEKHKKKYTAYMYPDVNHGFHNDTTPRFDTDAATLAWKRTLEFFDANLRATSAQPPDKD
jgi:carboxymethylenebutenolidase